MFILLASLLVVAIFGLTVMRNDAGRLVLDPLRRMLKIVVRCTFQYRVVSRLSAA
jgi:hypothetical protein